MEQGNKILLIENQFTQFCEIFDHLSDYPFEVFPKRCEQDFVNFINIVRIYLNRKFGSLLLNSRRQIMYSELINIINNSIKPDIIIIDYILVGHSESENGIFLAKKLRASKITIPILFLSKEHKNKDEILVNLTDDLNPIDWCHKGYAGKSILQKEYFEKHVYKMIEDLLKKSSKSLYEDKINLILNGLSDFNTDEVKNYGFIKSKIEDKLKDLLKSMEIKEYEKSALDAFNMGDYHERINFYYKLFNLQP